MNRFTHQVPIAAFRSTSLSLCVFLAGCATQSAASSSRLPYHVAIVPPVLKMADSRIPPEGDPTSMTMSFDAAVVAQQMLVACEAAFAKASRVPDSVGAGSGLSTEDRRKAYAKYAQEIGADVLLQPSLTYDTELSTQSASLVLSCLAFALGGPVGWFVEDRGYLCRASIQGSVYDVSTLNLNTANFEGDEGKLLTEEREAREHVMRFVDRADGAGAYLLSLICPAVFLAKESAAVQTGAAEQFGNQLSAALVEAMREKAGQLKSGVGVGNFVVEGPRVTNDGGKRTVVGRVVLDSDAANELTLQFRLATSEGSNWQRVVWSGKSESMDATQKNFDFAIPVESANATMIQIRVEANDAKRHHRTYTILLPKGQDS